MIAALGNVELLVFAFARYAVDQAVLT